MIANAVGKIDALCLALGSDFELDTDMLRDAVLRARCANAFHLPTVTKIDFFGGEVSDKQWRDVVSVLRIGGEALDREYLTTWATRLAVLDLLERARK